MEFLTYMNKNINNFLIDNDSLTNEVVSSALEKNIFVLRDTVDEYASTRAEILKIENSGIKILEMDYIHFQRLIILLKKHGTNKNLIRLFSNKGKADVLILAYILAERDDSGKLFPDNYILITKDRELTKIAENYEISCLKELPQF